MHRCRLRATCLAGSQRSTSKQRARRHYSGRDSPLREALARYAEFFDLFETFDGYVSSWLLDGLVAGGEIGFFHPFPDFATPAVPKTLDDYVRYVEASNAFVAARDERIRSCDPSTSTSQLNWVSRATVVGSQSRCG